MADDKANDVQDDQVTAALEDEGQDSPKDSSPKEAKETKETKEAEKPEAKGKEEADTPVPPDVPTKAETESEEETPAEETETADKPTKADERKIQLNTEIRDLVARKNALQADVEKANAEVYQPATEDELTEQGMTAVEAKVEAMRQEREMEKYNSQVADAQLTIGHESNRVLQDFPIFNPDSESYDEELAGEASELLRANLILDPNTNQVIGSNVSPYQLYQTLARASGISATKGQLKGQQDTEQMLASADNAGSASPPKKPKDPVLDILASDEY